jgi:hypothetical protein
MFVAAEIVSCMKNREDKSGLGPTVQFIFRYNNLCRIIAFIDCTAV